MLRCWWENSICTNVYVYDTSEFGTRFTSKEKTGFCTYHDIYLHRLETLGLLHAVAIDASGMVDKALQDFAACSVCVNLPECDTDG